MIDPKNIVALNNLEILGTKKIDPSQKIEEALRSYDNESLPHPDPRNPYNDPRNKRTLGESSNEKMIKIFISYSRRDAGDFAEQIQRDFIFYKRYHIFKRVDSRELGEVSGSSTEYYISACDIFVLLVTYGALQSTHLEKDVLQAQRKKKRIIPCFHKNVRAYDIKWGLRFKGLHSVTNMT